MIKRIGAALGIALVTLTVSLFGISAPRASAASSAPLPSHAGYGHGKTARTALTGCTTCFYYTVGSESPTGGANGLVTAVDIVKPTINTTKGDFHSLWEIAAQDTVHGNTIEAGYTVDPTVCGSIAASPCLFGFLWVNGSPKGYNASSGWVNAVAGSGACNVPAGTVSPVLLGQTVPLGSYVSFSLQHAGTWPNGVWWITYTANTAHNVACLPDSTIIAKGATSDFSKPDYWQVFGELASSHDYGAGVKPCGQIGSGTFGHLGNTVTPIAARNGNMAYIGGPATVNMYVRSDSNTTVDPDYDTLGVGTGPYYHAWYWGGHSTATSPTC